MSSPLSSSRPSRTPEHITKMIALLQTLWLLHPEWRLGQLVENAIVMGCRATDHRTIATYNVGDDIIEAGCRALIKKS